MLLRRSNTPTTPPPQDPKDTGFRRLLSRQQSITRGTASSIAKAVRTNSGNEEKSPPSDKLRRKFSLKSNRQSVDLQRRSSWSMFSNTVRDSPPLVRKQSKLFLTESPINAGNQKTDSLETPDEGYYHHHHNDDDLPGYMQRTICSACTRNIKVTSSSETNESRRFSFSTSTTTKSQSSLTDSLKLKQDSVQELRVKSKDSLPECESVVDCLPEKQHESKGSFDRDHSTQSTDGSVEQITLNSEPEDKPRETADDGFQSELAESTNTEGPFSEVSSIQETRSNSPSSPIPNKLRDDMKQEKWYQLLSQQHNLLSSLLPTCGDDQDRIMIEQDISKLVTTPQEYETLLLETQNKVLQKLVSCLQQAQTVEKQPAFVPCNWQTKLEFNYTRWKWNLSQWTGSNVGTGTIEEVDFDSFGYPENVVISGVCVTIEPGLLPKELQKYHKLAKETQQVICHRYVLRLTKEQRLREFQIKQQKEWINDDRVEMCEFSIKREDRKKTCQVKFGLFDRKHHCRSCGHIFCFAHSSNELPLFISNRQDCGEWARVCDSCFYSRIEPQCISRS